MDGGSRGEHTLDGSSMEDNERTGDTKKKHFTEEISKRMSRHIKIYSHL